MEMTDLTLSGELRVVVDVGKLEELILRGPQ